MKGICIKKLTGSIAIVAVLLLSGCALHNATITGSSVPFYLAYESEEVIRDQSKVATITSTLGLEIDGVIVNRKNMRSTTAETETKSNVVVDVLPGEHRIRLTSSQHGLTQVSPVTRTLEAGQIYNVTFMTVSVVVQKNNNANVMKKIAEKRNNAIFE